MPDSESAEFERIVAELRAGEAPPPGQAPLERRRRRRRTLLIVGILLCVAAVALVAFGGVEGVVIAVAPWLLGLFLVIRSRSGE